MTSVCVQQLLLVCVCVGDVKWNVYALNRKRCRRHEVESGTRAERPLRSAFSYDMLGFVYVASDDRCVCVYEVSV